ncbi:MAG: hypothetical protein AMS18_04690 [Gemmatimonas sp. SG8_17]|nr:MAG: hypothetical protein AMS18_04690 [Gemmatimonas sp. SG8_17]
MSTLLMIRSTAVCLLVAVGAPFTLGAQIPHGVRPPVVDTVVVVTHNVFGADESRSNVLFRIANAIRFTTRSSVIRRELLFQAGEPFDSAAVAETQRNLRALGVFRDVAIDTVRIDGRLAVVVTTADGWSTQLRFSMRFTAGTFSWSGGLVEQNFLGRANSLGVVYRDEPDRTSFTFLGASDRALDSRIAVQGLYDDLSDGTRGNWSVGLPFRAWTDRSGFELPGDAGRERMLQYRDGEVFQTYQRRSFKQSGHIAYAPIAGSGRYLRVGVAGQVRREEYLLEADTGSVVPDTVSGAVGVLMEYARARFEVVTHYSAFAREEDLDLSNRVFVSAWLAPAAWGYTQTGLGLGIRLETGVPISRNFVRLFASANGLFNAAGLDSGQVWAGATVASRMIPRNATVLHVEGGIRQGTPPGREYDLGHGAGPRVFGPHAFTGDRALWGAIEHRSFLIDELGGLLGGGAWYADQPRRLGGNVGVGLRFGATRASGPNVGRIDLGYRFGEGFDGGRWAVSFGRGFAF